MCFCDIQLYNLSHIYSFWSGNGNEHFLVWEWEWTHHSQMSIRRGCSIQHHWRDTLAAVKWGTLRKREVTPIFVARYFSCAMWFHDYVTLFYTLNGHIVNSAVGEHRKWPREHMFAVNKYYVSTHKAWVGTYIQGILLCSKSICFVLKLLWAVQSWKLRHRKLIQITETDTLRRDLLCHVMPTTCIFGLPCTPATFLSREFCSLDVALVREWGHYSKVASFLGRHCCSQIMIKCLMETCEEK